MIFIFIFMYIENRERYIFFELKDLNIFFVEAKPSYSIYCCCSKNNNLYFFQSLITLRVSYFLFLKLK